MVKNQTEVSTQTRQSLSVLQFKVASLEENNPKRPKIFF
jgi:BMFP domain-containing protein YqiC